MKKYPLLRYVGDPYYINDIIILLKIGISGPVKAVIIIVKRAGSYLHLFMHSKRVIENLQAAQSSRQSQRTQYTRQKPVPAFLELTVQRHSQNLAQQLLFTGTSAHREEVKGAEEHTGQ